MSKSTDTPNVTLVNESNAQEDSVEKQSLVKRGVNFVKTHKKATIAVSALAGLVAVSAVAGRKTAPSIELTNAEVLEDGTIVGEVVEDTDTTVA